MVKQRLIFKLGFEDLNEYPYDINTEIEMTKKGDSWTAEADTITGNGRIPILAVLDWLKLKHGY